LVEELNYLKDYMHCRCVNTKQENRNIPERIPRTHNLQRHEVLHRLTKYIIINR
jgi:hypothetical protein